MTPVNIGLILKIYEHNDSGKSRLDRLKIYKRNISSSNRRFDRLKIHEYNDE